MKNYFCIVILGALILFPFSSLSYAKGVEEKYFINMNPKLTKQERKALAIAKRWKKGGDNSGIGPFTGKDGSIQYVFGAQYPSIVCAVLQVCDVALQAGEHVTSIQLGDASRWNVEPAISGLGSSKKQHLIIKPLDVGLETSLIVTTDRRVYHLRLRSHRTQYMPQVSFSYPEEALSKWDMIQNERRQEREANTIPGSREYLGDLSFDYKVSGTSSFKPIRVFNDGVKTIVEMPTSMQQMDAPSLLIVHGEGGLFSEPDTSMVNYRIQGNRYIVDTVFEKAILVSGVGGKQKKITITKGDK